MVIKMSMMFSTDSRALPKLHWGVIGAGGIADRRTLPGLIQANNAALAAVMEVARGDADRLAAKYGAPAAYTCHKELLADPAVQAVYIASPVAAHYEQAKDALYAGKHVLLEKPLALDPTQGEELITLAESKGLILAAGLMMRFHSHHQTARRLIQDGVLGQIVSVRAQLTCWYPEIPGAWRQSLATSGGGAMMDMGIHCIDLLQYLLGSRVTKVAALSASQTHGYEVEDGAGALLSFSNGAMGYVDAHFNIPDNAAEGRLELYGTKGSLLCAGTISQAEAGRAVLTLSEDTGYQAAQIREGQEGGELPLTSGDLYTKEIEAFGRSVLRGEPVAVPAADALQGQRIVLAAYESAKTGRFIEV